MRATFNGTGGGVTIIFGGDLTLDGDKVLGTNSSLYIVSASSVLNTANHALTLGGSFDTSSGGILTAGSSNITISGTAAQSIAGFTTTGDVSMTKTGGTATFGGNVNGGNLIINGSGGSLSLGSGNVHTFTGGLQLTAGILNGGSSTLQIAGDVTTGGAFTAAGGTVNYNGAAQTIGGFTYNNLTISGSGTKTLGAAATVNGTLSFAGGILNTGGSTFTLPGAAASVTGAGVVSAGAGGFVEGTLNKSVSGLSSVNYEVGSATNGYAPVLLTFSGAASGSGSLGVSVTDGAEPHAGSAISSVNITGQYWTISKTGTVNGPATITPGPPIIALAVASAMLISLPSNTTAAHGSRHLQAQMLPHHHTAHRRIQVLRWLLSREIMCLAIPHLPM